MAHLLPSPEAVAVIPPDEADFEEKPLPLSHYLWVLKRHRRKIFFFVLLCLISTYFVCLRLTPLYEAITTIDVDRQMPRGTMGDSTAESAIASPLDADQFLATQSGLDQVGFRAAARRGKASAERGRAEITALPSKRPKPRMPPSSSKDWT